MNKQILQGLINFLPQNVRNNAQQAVSKALEIIDPSTIRTKNDAIQALQKLKNNGLPASVINKVYEHLNNPLAAPMLSMLGVSKQDFQNGLQAISQTQPDNSSVITSSSLLQGVDQLK